MIGNYPDWQVQEYALGWYGKKVLTEVDLAEIEDKIAAQYVVEPTEQPETVTDETETIEPVEEVAEGKSTK